MAEVMPLPADRDLVLPLNGPAPQSYVTAPIYVLLGLWMLSRAYVLGGLILTGIGVSALCDVLQHHTGVDTCRVGWVAWFIGAGSLVAYLVRETWF